MLQYQLQYFAKDGPGGEKTEPATAKKLKDVRQDGKVAKSKELGNCFGLIALFLILKFWMGSLGEGMMGLFSTIYARFPELIRLVDGEVSRTDFSYLLRNVLLELLWIILPVFLVGFAVAFAVDILQVKWHVTWKPLQPKFDKLSPLAGAKKLFSMQSLVELLKSLLKIGLISYVVYSSIKDEWQVLYLLYDMSLLQALALAGDLIIGIGIKISIVYLIIALADYFYQRYKFSEDTKMTKQEVKDEYKNMEGDPQIRGKQKRKMREASMRRMMQNLPKADVVITNPTHFAVALQYSPETSDAPVVVAKGADYLAQKIKDVAKEHQIEIVENKPLARTIYHNVQVGASIPPELFQAVAEILAMVYKTKGKM